ncbi:ABC transporter permease [Sediminicola luteus]|uniref:ABC transporter permease n=1 Tax=Sediminicola luteus TaxID=319238 RepID=A0A2A4GEF2_9FLAO|nr:FtsX-like permease family protein [Sediminicola luteus]PCE66175.1 ABC transporter permease [Sediminicola luteus]
MLKNHFKIAWRNLLKNKGYSLINIGGLAIGMAVALLIGLWIEDELTYNDYFKHKDQIAQIYQNQTWNGNVGTGPALPRPLEKALRNQYADNFTHIVMSSWEDTQYLEYKDTKIQRDGNFMQAGAPEMLDLQILQGEKNGINDPNSIMLGESTAKALFGDEDPIGKIVDFNSAYPVTVTAVYADIPFNNSFNSMQFLASWEKYVSERQWVQNAENSWGNNSFQVFVQLADNLTMEQVTTKIIDIKKEANEDTREFNPELFLHPMKNWYLYGNFEDGKAAGGRITYVRMFGIIGIIVLLLACINFMNLSTARSEKRAKEVGIRKSIGSQRGQLISQFLGESFLITLFAFVMAIGLVFISLDGFNELARKEVAFPWNNPIFWVVSALFILFTTLLSGSYPALYLSSFKPVEVLKGTFVSRKKGVGPRQILVVIQFTASVAFIIGTLIVLQQINHTKNRPVGYEREGLIQIPAFSSDFYGKQDLLREEFKKTGAVLEVATSSAPTTSIWSNRSGFTWDGKPQDLQEDVAWTEVSVEYAQTLNLNVIEGRDFSREFASDSTAILINKTAVKHMGLTNPVGTIIREEDPDPEDPDPTILKIIGVVDDVIAQSPYEPVKQGWYVFNTDPYYSYLNLRLNPEKSATENLAAIERVFLEHFPDLPFNYQFVDEQYARKFRAEERVASLAGIFTALAIFISCLGLLGLASFVAEQRTKEIGVRKVLGASILNVWNMLSKDFVRLVIISCLIAVPIAYFLMSRWLQDYTYRIDISIWTFLMAGLGALAITLLTVSFQAIKAARTNPVKSLRTE